MTPEKIKRIFEVYERPFRYDEHGQSIVDSNDKHVLDIRGWGWLKYKADIDPIAIQDSLGKLIVELLNNVK